MRPYTPLLHQLRPHHPRHRLFDLSTTRGTVCLSFRLHRRLLLVQRPHNNREEKHEESPRLSTMDRMALIEMLLRRQDRMAIRASFWTYQAHQAPGSSSEGDIS